MPIAKTKTTQTNTRRFEDLHINGGSGDGTWSLIEEWFADEDAEFSIPFTITEAFNYADGSKRSKYGFGIMMEGDDADEVLYYIAVPATNSKGESHKERQKLFDMFQGGDTSPITGCVMQRIDTGQANPFIKFISVEAMQRVIDSETESEDD